MYALLDPCWKCNCLWCMQRIQCSRDNYCDITLTLTLTLSVRGLCQQYRRALRMRVCLCRACQREHSKAGAWWSIQSEATSSSQFRCSWLVCPLSGQSASSAVKQCQNAAELRNHLRPFWAPICYARSSGGWGTTFSGRDWQESNAMHSRSAGSHVFVPAYFCGNSAF